MYRLPPIPLHNKIIPHFPKLNSPPSINQPGREQRDRRASALPFPSSGMVTRLRSEHSR